MKFNRKHKFPKNIQACDEWKLKYARAHMRLKTLPISMFHMIYDLMCQSEKWIKDHGKEMPYEEKKDRIFKAIENSSKNSENIGEIISAEQKKTIEIVLEKLIEEGKI